MLPYRDSRLTKIALVLFFLIVLGYAYYEARGLLFGPSINFASTTATAVRTPYVIIQGRTAHIASLAVDGEPIQVTETGAFQEPYVLAPGVNRIVFDAKDKYGNAAEKVIEIVYTPSATTAVPAMPATSTPPAASPSSSVAPGQ
jgi:hypothetical protein